MASKTKILIVEDDELMSRMYQTKLTFDGYDVLTAFDGESGLAMAGKELPDLILLDVMMPKMDGLQVLEKLKADTKTKNIPVIILTNLGGMKSPEVKGMELGAVDYLIKSDMTPAQVVEKIKSHIKS